VLKPEGELEGELEGERGGKSGEGRGADAGEAGAAGVKREASGIAH
jgi:hypothetical protein